MNLNQKLKLANEKIKEIKKLAKKIEKTRGTVLTPEQNQEIDNLQFSLEFRMKNSAVDAEIALADFKIDVYKQVIKIIEEAKRNEK